MGFFDLTESDVATIGEGDARFKVLSAENTISRKGEGSPMIKLSLMIKDSRGASEIMNDYLVKDEKNRYKIKAFLASLGHIEWFKAPGFDTDHCIGLTGTCNIKLQVGKNGYADKMGISKYLPANKQSSSINNAEKHHEPANKDPIEDGIPF